MSFTAVLERLQKLENPYPGLRPFETSEQHLFFGRDQQIAELVARLECNRFVAVEGMSGGGKSSLVRAGLIPALQRGSVGEAGVRWRMVVTRPAGAPFASLAVDLGKNGLDPSALRQSSLGLVQVARQLPREETLLVVVDQFEELFRYKDCEPFMEEDTRSREEASSEASEFVQLLLSASRQQPPIYIVLTMRSEYLGDCAEFRDLPETLNTCQYLVPRLTRDQRKQAIEGPLGRTPIAASLVQRILNDTGDEPDQLPVLQHALMRTWRQWQESDPQGKRGIQLQDYEAPSVGGLAYALEIHAEGLLGKVPAEIAIAETVFKRLTGGTSRERRNPSRLDELWELCGAHTDEQRALVNKVIDRFRLGEATFLTPRDGGLKAEKFIDITHESLIRKWRRLRRWVGEESENRATFMRIYDDAQLCATGKGDLWRDPKLQLALDWWHTRKPNAAWVRHFLGRAATRDEGLQLAWDFLEKSRQAEEEERVRESRKRRRTLVATVIFILVLMVVIIWGAFNQEGKKAEHQLAVARALLWESSVNLNERPDQLIPGTLYAVESVKREATPASLQILQLAVRLLRKPSAHFQPQGTLWGMAFSPDGHFLATASEEKMAAVYDQHGNKVHELADEGEVWSVAFSAAGDYLATGGRRGVRLFDTASWKPVWPPRTQDPVISVAFSPDGQLLAIATAWEGVLVLDVGTGKELWDTKRAGRSVAFSPKGGYLGIGGDLGSGRQLCIMDARTRRSVLFKGDKELNRPVLSVAFSPDDRFMAIGSADSKAYVFDVQLGNQAMSLSLRDAVAAVAFSPDARYLAAGSYDGTARVFDFPEGREVLRRPQQSPVISVAFSGNGTLASASRNRGVDVFEVTSADEIAWLPPASKNSPQQVTTTWDMKSMAVVDEGGSARLFELGSRKSLSPVIHLDGANQVALSTGGQYLAMGGKLGTAVFESSTGKPRFSLPERSPVKTLDLTPDGHYLATGSEDAVRVYDVVSQKLAWEQREKDVSSISFSRDGGQLAVGGEMQELEVFSAATGGQLRAVPFHWYEENCEELRKPCSLNSIAFSKDGRFAALTGTDYSVRVIDVAHAREICLLRLPANPVNAILSEDDRFVATSSDDLVGRVYEVKTSRELWRMNLGVGDFFPLAFVSHDKYLILGTGSHYLLMERYLWHPQDLMDSACAVVGRNLKAEEWPARFDKTRPQTCSNLP